MRSGKGESLNLWPKARCRSGGEQEGEKGGARKTGRGGPGQRRGRGELPVGQTPELGPKRPPRSGL
jgi:hypothetical protein